MSRKQEETRLAWKDSRWQSVEGLAGDVPLFSIHYHTQRNEPAWFMRSQLPGLGHLTWKHDSKDELKDTAETVLDAWLTRIGAFL